MSLRMERGIGDLLTCSHNVLEGLWSGSDADNIIHSDAANEQHVLKMLTVLYQKCT